MSNLLQVTPFLLVQNIENAIAFFRGTLGFRVLFRLADYAYVHRETVGFRLLEGSAPEMQPGTRRYAYYIDVKDVDALYAELKPKLDSLPPGSVEAPVNREYEMREFLVLAPDGNWIAFGQEMKRGREN